MNNEVKIEIFKKAALSRIFEECVFNYIKQAKFKCPIYLSAGQEFIPATIATLTKRKPSIFAQHRAHHTYLSFGGEIVELIDELLGRKTGCANGMGGSASIHSFEKNIFGHDGLMGSQVPIAVGHVYETRKPTIVIMGDASAEEDYVLGALGWASTKNLPILFIVEDNNLSILTEKKVRRNWEMVDVTKGFNMEAHNINDNPISIWSSLINYDFSYPMLLNINTTRKYWHAGAGKDDEYNTQYEMELKALGEIAEQIDIENKQLVEKLWQQQLEIQ